MLGEVSLMLRNEKDSDFANLMNDVIEIAKTKNSAIQVDSISHISNRANVRYSCNIHPEVGTQSMRLDVLKKSKFPCKKCRSEHMSIKHSGENSPTWKGGKTGIRSYLRCFLSNWIKATLQAYDYKCFLSGSNTDLEVHHITCFNSILEKAEKELCVSIEGSVSDFSEADIVMISMWIEDYHMKNDIGIVLAKEVHKEFHDKYGRGSNDLSQFQEFCGTFNKSFLANIKSLEGFRAYKVYGTSKYIGVHKNTSRDIAWVASISFKGKQIHIGTYATEYRAATAYNLKALELFGENAKVNDMSSQHDIFIYEDSYYRFKDRNKSSSIYTGVNYYANGWRYEVIHSRKKLFTGTAKTEVEAAYLYNMKKLELLGQNAILNFLTEEEENQAFKDINKEYEYSYFKHKNSSTTKYTYVTPSGKKWSARVKIGNKTTVIGNTYLTDREAAIAYNEYVILHGIEKSLNAIA